MTQDFLSSSFRYRQVLGVTDVADIITVFRDEVLNQLSTPWTEPDANTFQSPEDEMGHFFTAALASAAVTRLQVTVKDLNGTAIADRCVDIDAGGNAVQVYTGQFHFFVESSRAGGGEVAGGGLLDLSPEAVGNVGLNAWHQFFMMSDGAPVGSGRVDVGATGGSGASPNKTCASVFLFNPMMMVTLVGESDSLWIGRVHQSLRCSDELGPGSEVTVPVDSGAKGVFRVVARGADRNCRMCVRKASMPSGRS